MRVHHLTSFSLILALLACECITLCWLFLCSAYIKLNALKFDITETPLITGRDRVVAVAESCYFNLLTYLVYVCLFGCSGCFHKDALSGC